jgi:hypothetical protein
LICLGKISQGWSIARNATKSHLFGCIGELAAQAVVDPGLG